MEKLGLVKINFIVVVFCAAAVIAAPAQTFTTLVNFDGSNGAAPCLMSLVQGTDGNYRKIAVSLINWVLSNCPRVNTQTVNREA